LKVSNLTKSSKTPFRQWLDNTYPNNDDRVKFMKDNYIPNDVSLELKDFERFYEKRKEILRDKIKEVLCENGNGV